MALHVFDLDGVLADSSHRYRTMPCGTRIDLPYWREHEHLAWRDQPLPLAETYRELLAKPGELCVIATARIGDAITRAWIDFHLGGHNGFIARRDENDTRGGAALKLAGLRRYFGLRQYARLRDDVVVYEDNRSYLDALCQALGARGVFVPSNQGH